MVMVAYAKPEWRLVRAMVLVWGIGLDWLADWAGCAESVSGVFVDPTADLVAEKQKQKQRAESRDGALGRLCVSVYEFAPIIKLWEGDRCGEDS